MPQQNSWHLLTAEANFECDPNDQHFGVFYINKKQKNKIVSGFHTHACTKVLPWTSQGFTALPRHQLQQFLALPKTDARIFFLYNPLSKVVHFIDFFLCECSVYSHIELELEKKNNILMVSEIQTMRKLINLTMTLFAGLFLIFVRPWHVIRAIARTHTISSTNQEKGGLHR